MAHTHLQAGEVGDIRPLGAGLVGAKSSVLFKTAGIEAIRMVLPKGKEVAEHRAPGEIIVQCLEGCVAWTSMGKTQELRPGQLLYLAAAEPHSVLALEDSSILVTILLKKI